MLYSLALIFLLGLAGGALFKKIKLPSIIGMLAVGVLLGPHALNLLDDSVLSISAELRQAALVIILLKAGLSLDLADLKKVGRPALMMSCIPASMEILGYFLLAPYILHITRLEAAIVGSVLAAVSPAVVVPRMVKLTEEGYGKSKGIPQLIMAGASCDDIFVIVLFSTFTDMAQGGSAGLAELVKAPLSILLGIAAGAAVGRALTIIFETAYRHGMTVRNSVKVIIILGVAFLLTATEKLLENYLPLSGLLAVVSMACVIKAKCPEPVPARLSEKFGKLWIAAEVLLFVLVGAAVDIGYTLAAGLPTLLMLFAALIFRSLGVALCLIGTNLSAKERLFCVIAYLPKATVQAAIGSVPLALGLRCGSTVLSTAVLGIIVTAPLGAAGIDATYKRLLTKNQPTVEISY